MKITATLVGFGAVYAAAQEVTYPQGFPDCGKTCVNNMLSQAADLGCTDAAPSCLCTKQNFIYGVRDCATESCQDQSLAQQVIQYGSQYCASVGIAVSGIPTATGENPTASTTVLATAGPTNSASGTQSGSSNAGASGSIPITTATFETTISASGSDVTSTITSTSFSASEASASGTGASGTESGSASSGVIESTTVTSNGSTFATTTSAAEHTSSQTSEGSSESQTGSGSESESASSTSNPAAQRTAAPVGFIAAAGLAALML
ncbi:hypothetical protein F4804DRAFT_41235 [Jackrogersella minutella]|nr:hypothetical protein F4804DRAFT_41235 [Jackrogersella minutella]